VPFSAAVETNSQGHPKRVVSSPVKSFSLNEVEAWTYRRLKTSATVVSDGLGCFRAIATAGCIRQLEFVKKHRESTAMGCFHWVNIILGNLKSLTADLIWPAFSRA